MAESLIRAHIQASATTLGILSTSIFEGPLRKSGNGIPSLSIWCQISGGPPVQSYMGSASMPLKPQVGRIFVRGEPRTYLQTRTLAEDVLDFLHDATITGIIRVACESGAPLYWGPNAVDEEEFSIPIRVLTEM